MPQFTRYESVVNDPSGRNEARKCLKKYFFTRVLGFRAPGNNIAMYFGTCYHKFREVIEREYMENKELAADDLFDHCLRIGMIIVEKMWKGDPPLDTKFDFLTKTRLQKSCMLAWTRWKEEKRKGQVEVIAPEQAFDLFFKDGKTRSGGKIDQVIRMISKPWIKDFKASSKNEVWYQRLTNPSDQFSAYIWAGGKLIGEDIYGLKVEVLHNTKKEGPSIYELTTTRTTSQLERWENDQILLEEIISLCREKDVWPENSQQCPWCEFHMVCQMPTMASQAAKLQSGFRQEPWDFKKVEDIV